MRCPLLVLSLFLINCAVATMSVSIGGKLRIILGTMSFGSQTDAQTAEAQIRMFKEAGYSTLDTARMYVHGQTEQLLGEIMRNSEELKELEIDSKVNAFKGYGYESLTPPSVIRQMNDIRDALGCEQVNTLYLHAPDHSTPIEETLACIQSLFEEGRFKRLGLSNYPAWEVVYIWSYMKSRGWVLPSVYQGMYNPITRQVEAELFPALQKLGISFYAYNPLCGGLLTGKHNFSNLEDSKGTRFDASNQMYLTRYWNDRYFSAVEIIKAACEQEGKLTN